MSLECYCGSPMIQRSSKYGVFWGCTRWPECDGVMSAHKSTGEPMGIPADQETRNARIEAHAAFDGMWQRKKWNRHGAYVWLSRRMKLEFDKTHIALFTKEQCDAVILICA